MAAFPAAAQADLQTIDFDAAPPAVGSPIDGVGDVSFPTALGFRPYRTDVGARAHSGTAVGDLGRCVAETEATGGEAGSCEFFQAQTTGVLARTARSVTLFAGRFTAAGPFDEPEQAVLTAFSASGARLATTGPVAIDAAGFDQRLSVSSEAGDIAGFRVEARLGPNGENENAGDLGIDDLAVDFAEGGSPDFALTTTNQVIAVVQGQQAEVPVQIVRLNGSNGPVQLSVSGLPAGVAATPVTVPGSQSTATIVLQAGSYAPDTGFLPTDATITADPLGDANVGPGPRMAALSVRVADDFAIGIGGFNETHLPANGRIPIALPDCAPVDVPLTVSRDIAFDQDISLTLREDRAGATGLPTGIGAGILPSPVVSPGGPLVAERTIRLSASDMAALGYGPLPVVLGGSAGGGPLHALPLALTRAIPKATIANSTPGSGLGDTPRFGQQGTRVRIHGTGFCPGTSVKVGNEFSRLPAKVVDDHTLEFTVPRYATTGPVTIFPPGSLPFYNTDDALEVDSVRNVDGFPFSNPQFGSLSLDEFTRAFGADEIFVTVNPCWPFGHCRVVTGILDPSAAVIWGILSEMPEAHCFGMTLGIQQLKDGTASYREFSGKRDARVFDLGGPGAPTPGLESFLDVEQVKQFSNEFLSVRHARNKAFGPQLGTMEREFGRNRLVIVHISGEGEGHSLLAYDLAQTPVGMDIYTYNPNEPFHLTEGESDGFHHSQVDNGVVHIDQDTGTWSYPIEPGVTTWSGDLDDGSLWVSARNAVPADPSLPGEKALASWLGSVIFNSRGGSVRTESSSPGAEFVPVSDGRPGQGAGGAWVSGERGDPLAVTFRGVKDGSYSQAYAAPGFVAAAEVSTAKGVRDTVRGDGDSLTFESGEARPLRLRLAGDSGPAGSVAATLDTHASAQGSDTAGFGGGGALTYAHDGAPTVLGFSLSTVRRDGGPATFVSGPLAVGRGDRLSARPLDRELHHVRLTVRDSEGGTTSRVLSNRGHAHGHLKLHVPKVSDHHIALRVQLTGIHGHAVVGASLRLMRGGHVAVHRAVALKGVDGTRTIVLRLPRSVDPGRYRLLTDVRAMTPQARGSTAAGSESAHRASPVIVGR